MGDIKDALEEITAKVMKSLENAKDGEMKARIVMERSRMTCTRIKFQKMDDLELTSLRALICYAAANANIPENIVTQRVSAMFSAKDPQEIDRRHYDAVVSVLVDCGPWIGLEYERWLN